MLNKATRKACQAALPVRGKGREGGDSTHFGEEPEEQEGALWAQLFGFLIVLLLVLDAAEGLTSSVQKCWVDTTTFLVASP